MAHVGIGDQKAVRRYHFFHVRTLGTISPVMAGETPAWPDAVGYLYAIGPENIQARATGDFGKVPGEQGLQSVPVFPDRCKLVTQIRDGFTYCARELHALAADAFFP